MTFKHHETERLRRVADHYAYGAPWPSDGPAPDDFGRQLDTLLTAHDRMLELEDKNAATDDRPFEKGTDIQLAENEAESKEVAVVAIAGIARARALIQRALCAFDDAPEGGLSPAALEALQARLQSASDALDGTREALESPFEELLTETKGPSWETVACEQDELAVPVPLGPGPLFAYRNTNGARELTLRAAKSVGSFFWAKVDEKGVTAWFTAEMKQLGTSWKQSKAELP